MDLRRRWPREDLFILGLANGSIGYLPDAPAFDHPGYATVQSPKFTGQFPFVPQSGAAMVDGLLGALQALR